MSQTSYSRTFTQAFAGQLGDSGPNRIGSYVNDQGADIPAGCFVVHKAEGTADLPASATEKLAGVVVNSFARNPDDLSGTAAIQAGDTMNVLEEGAIWVSCEEALAVGADVYVRYASGAGGSVLGLVRSDGDTSSARRATGARVLVPSTGAGLCMIYFSAAADRSNL